MSRLTYACLVMGLILLAAPVGALIPDKIEILDPSPDDWVTAGSGEPVTIVVQVSNITSGNTLLRGVAVSFAVNNGIYGSISPTQAVTDGDGKATAVFRPGTRSGDVTITATVALNASLNDSADLHIDHVAPYQINNTWYSRPMVTVGETTAITVRMVDRYENVVDSKREDALGTTAESVTFTVGSPNGGAVFVGGTDKITVPVNAHGNATVTLRVDTVAGENIVWIQPPKSVRGQYIAIRGVADGVPASIICTPNPPGASVPANGKDKITLMYELLDAYGNPAGGKGLWVNASVEDPEKNRLIYSSSLGQVWVTYGPAESIGIVTINATVDNVSPIVSNTTVLEFTSTEPEDMLLSASPQSMPGRDVNESSVAKLRAKVMDVKGNPVEGETVTFEIISNTSAPYNQTVDQALKGTSATTDISGSAVTEFYPGAFTTDRKAPGWSATATGTATVQATWKNATRGIEVNRDIVLTWKNYPYLSVETEVSRANVAVNSTDGISNTTDVTIRLKGDGYALQPDPIDVVLCTDRSGSMLKDYPDRMVKAMEASEIFNAQMNYPRDHLGLISFGKSGETDLLGYGYREWLGKDNTNDDDRTYRRTHYPSDKKTYADYATVDLSMSDNPSTINITIGQMVPDWGTPMRSGIYKAINELKDNGRADAVKAIIILSDGDYNHYGDPLARGTAESSWDPSQFSDITTSYLPFYGLGEGRTSNQNMSVFAMSNDIRIYSIAFANDISDDGKKTLEILAKSTGGEYYYAPTGNDLAGIYTDIAGELKTEAGVDTTMIILENVEMSSDQVLDDLISIPAYEVFTYVHDATNSTHIHNQTKTDNPAEPKVLFDGTINQLNDWKNNRKLSFDIGTICLDQTWEATFRLAVNSSYRGGENNNINIFGDGTKVTFNNGEDATDADTLSLPDTFITIFPDLTNEGITSAFLDVEFTGPVPGSGPYTDVAPLTWTTTYNGTKGVDVSFASSPYEDGRQSSTFFTKTLSPETFAAMETITNSTLMDVRGLTPGEYWITVTASAHDARNAEDTTSLWAHAQSSSSDYIKIE